MKVGRSSLACEWKKEIRSNRNNTGNKTGVEQSWYESGQLKHKTNWDSSGQKNGEESEFY